jgi:GT2 family glycosyltransferase
MVRERNKTLSLVIYLGDILATGSAFLCAYAFRGILPQDSARILYPFSMYSDLFGPILVTWSLLLYLMGLYRYWKGSGFGKEAWEILKAVSLSTLLLSFFVFALKHQFVSRIFILSFALFDLILIILFRLLLRKAIQFFYRRSEGFRSVLVVGSGPEALEMVRGMGGQKDPGLRVRGFLSTADSAAPAEINGYPVLGETQDLPEILEREWIDEVIFAAPQDELKRMEFLIRFCKERGVSIFPLNRNQEMPVLSIILVSYNTAEFILSCLRSIEQCLPALAHEIIVVDNHSQDESWPLIRREFPGLNLMGNPTNVGFGRAVNQGFRAAKGKYILIMNPDVTLLPGSVEKALSYLEEHPEVALLLPKLLNSDGSLQFSCRTFFDVQTLLLRRTPLRRFFTNHQVLRDHLMMDWDHEEPREVDWGMGACMFLRKEEIQDENIFDERFFLYFEDVDLCFRLKNEGRKVLYYPEAVMVHYHVRESARWFMNRAKWELYRSLVKFYLKHRRLKPPKGVTDLKPRAQANPPDPKI